MRNSSSGSSGPYLVRDEALAEPGVHTHNGARRTTAPELPHWRSFLVLRFALFLLGLAATGYYGYTLIDDDLYQGYQNWSFDQQIAGRPSPSFGDYLRDRLPFGGLAGQPSQTVSEPRPAQPVTRQQRPQIGSLLGRLSIERLGIAAVVREGTDAATLSRAVGHIPSTSLAGQLGNCSIAAHRDTLFRGLKNIHLGDVVQFQTPTATYDYRVIATQIVKPSDVSVLRADGGPTFLRQISSTPPPKLLTMITCYPFNYIGSAPERFIVQAAAVDNASGATPAGSFGRTVAQGSDSRRAHLTHYVAAARLRRRWHRDHPLQ